MSVVTLHSTRFGRLEIPARGGDRIPDRPHRPGRRPLRAPGAREEDSAFIWLHSLEDPELAIPVTNPWRFFPTYEVELSDDEADRIGIEDSEATVGLRDRPRRRGPRGLLRQPAPRRS